MCSTTFASAEAPLAHPSAHVLAAASVHTLVARGRRDPSPTNSSSTCIGCQEPGRHSPVSTVTLTAIEHNLVRRVRLAMAGPDVHPMAALPTDFLDLVVFYAFGFVRWLKKD